MRPGEMLARMTSLRDVSRPMFLFLSFLGLALLLATSLACGPPSPQTASDSSSAGVPELTDETIHERINDAWIRDVLPESGTAEPITWSFDRDEPKEIAVVDKQVEGTRATIVLDIKTSTSPRARNQRHLAGQIRTEWELKTGWVLRRWEIVDAENISMKYKDLPKPAAQNPSR